MKQISFDGYALGGLSVGELKEEMLRVLDVVAPEMPADRPRHRLTGVLLQGPAQLHRRPRLRDRGPPTGTDGGYMQFEQPRERNLGQGTLLGGLPMFTTYQPYNDVCLSEGLSNLYGGLANYPVTNGYAWYQTFGDLNDWSYGVRGDPDDTIEVWSPGYNPPTAQIETQCLRNWDAILQTFRATQRSLA